MCFLPGGMISESIHEVDSTLYSNVISDDAGREKSLISGQKSSLDIAKIQNSSTSSSQIIHFKTIIRVSARYQILIGRGNFKQKCLLLAAVLSLLPERVEHPSNIPYLKWGPTLPLLSDEWATSNLGGMQGSLSQPILKPPEEIEPGKFMS